MSTAGKYLPLNTHGSVAIAVCPRCQFKVQYADLRQDPNTQNWMCKDCVDVLDPWRLPARNPEDITLLHPRKDEELV